MNPNEDYEDRLADLREDRYRALGTRSPRCSTLGCTETDPIALTGARPNITCHEHLADQMDCRWTQYHHLSGQANSPDTGALPANDHAAVSAMQSLWPRDTLRNPEGSPLLRAAAAVRGWLDMLRMMIERTLRWVPAALESLDALLTDRHGPRWWDQLGWTPRTAWDRRGLIVGHNLPFDLARLSISHHPPQSRGSVMRGGFSFTLSPVENASRVQVKKANAGAAFIRLTIPGGINPEERNRQRGGRQPNHHGYFLDTATLGGAMFGGRASLGRLAELLETRHRKSGTDHGETITAAYLDYLCNDVRVTSECAVELQRRFERYQLPKHPWGIYSEATIGKAHMEKMGLRPFRELNSWPSKIIATVMETYYGGRAECAVRKIPVPGVYVDFTSQYPTVFALQDLHRFLTAKNVSYHREDPRRVQQVLDRLTPERTLDPVFWRTELTALVLIAPEGDRLPTRARYNATRRSHKTAGRPPMGSYNVGVSYRHGGPPQWYTLADACASKLMTGRTPRILEVMRFAPESSQDGLEPIDIAGDAAYRVDPACEDFIRRLVELRGDVRAEQKKAEGAKDAVRAAGLNATQQAMKITANGTAYGSAIELNPVEHRKGAWVTVHLPNASSYRLHRERTEEPGRWFHPLIATLVAGAGRLLLATAMRLTDDLGGSWAFCDTDSLFIIATEHGQLIPCAGGKHRTPDGRQAIKALSWEETRRIVGSFASLDPYHGPDHPKSILKVEDENYDPETGEQREIECLAIAAKRYGLFTRRLDGTPDLFSAAARRSAPSMDWATCSRPTLRAPIWATVPG